MVLTAIGVCAGSFLSWPVALLTTIAFFVAGQLAFSFLVDFTRQAIMGGGPFESLIRLLTHDNQMSELTPTAGVVLAKSLDSLVMPLMSLLVYVVPNFQALDVSNMVADGFAVSWRLDRHQHADCARVCIALLIGGLSYPEESGGRRMSSASNFNKKIIYGLIIVALFGIMFPYSSRLAEEKKRRDLGEAAIGQIDTGSFMMKLFLLGGFRGIVADLLWLRTEEYKKDHDWDRLKTTVELITKLQPHFLSIWTFQGWNLAYNVSVEWDAPEDKYEWIKQGIKFVQEGVKKNRAHPTWYGTPAWFYYHKFGFADESIILRRLFRDDEEEAFKTYFDPESGHHVVGNDNFKLGYGWFTRSVTLVNSGANRVAGSRLLEIEYVNPSPQRKGKNNDIAFRSMPAHGQTRYAAGLEKMSTYGIEAQFGEVAQNEWARALQRVGQAGRARVHVAQRDSAQWQAGTRPRQAGRLDHPRTLQPAQRKPEVLDIALGRPDELSLLERAMHGRKDGRRRAGPAILL